MDQFSNFIKLLNDYIALFDALIEIEQEKLMAAKKNRITFVEEAMKKEQVFILKLRGFDKKREQLQQELGFSSLSFQEILDQSSGREKEQLLLLFPRFKERMLLLQEVSENAKKMIEINLHTIEKSLAQQKNSSVINRQTGTFHSKKI